MQKLLNFHNRLYKYIVAVLFLFIPLYPKFPLFGVAGSYVSIRLEDIILAMAAISTIIAAYPYRKEILRNKVVAAIILFLVVGLTSTLFGIHLTHTVDVRQGFLHWSRRIEYFIPLFMGYIALKIDKRNSNFYLKLMMVTVVYVFIYGFGQVHFGWPVIITQNTEYSKGVALRWLPGSQLNSTFAGHYDLAAYLVLVMPIIIVLFFNLKNIFSRIIILFTFFSGLWLLVNTASRISILAYFVSATAALVLSKNKKFIPIVLIISILFVGFSSSLLDRYLRLFNVVRGKVTEINISADISVYAQQGSNQILPLRYTQPSPTPIPVFEDRSTSIRLNVEWPRAVRAFIKNPIFGSGYSSVGLAIDNDFLRMLAEVGILGFTSFLLIFFRFFIYFLKKFPLEKNFGKIEYAFVCGVCGAIPGLMINALFIDIFEASKFAVIFWLFFGMVLLIITQKNYES